MSDQSEVTGAVVLETWRYTAPAARTAVVIPDGCRDVIVRRDSGREPVWFISELQQTTKRVTLPAGTTLEGYRLAPGAVIDETRLQVALTDVDLESDMVVDRIVSCVARKPAVSEALACLGSGASSVADCALRLGVSVRTLQRTVKALTSRPPGFWLQLARVRRAARTVTDSPSLAEHADLHGFSDQAHMTREFRRWLGITPRQIRQDTVMPIQLAAPGYY